MTDTLPADHQLGANGPPEKTLPELLAYLTPGAVALTLKAQHADLFARADKIIAAKDRLPDEIPLHEEPDENGLTTLDRVIAMVKTIRDCDSALDVARSVAKKPFDDAGKEVQQTFNPVREKLTPIKARCERMVHDRNVRLETQRREEAVRAAQAARKAEDERLASAAQLETLGHGEVAATVMQAAQDSGKMADKMEAMASGSTQDLVRTASAAGTTSSSSRLVHRVTDNEALRKTLGPLGDYFSAAEIDKAIRAKITADKKAGRAPVVAGVEFYDETKAIIR